MGSSKGSSSSAPVVTQEQKDQLKAQTGFLTDTLIPTYQKTIGGAGDVLGNVQGMTNQAANAGYNLTGNVAQGATAAGTGMVGLGASGLAGLFDPNYERGQVNAALQAGREATREQLGGQNAMYGAAGGLGSSRHALADQNLAQLGSQRQATAAAGAQAQVQANKAAAAQSLMSGGQGLLGTGLSAAGQQVGMAGAPLDAYSKYASIVFGTPGSGGGNFAGTQGSNTSGKSMKIG